MLGIGGILRMGKKLAGVEAMEGVTCLLGVPRLCLESGDQSISAVVLAAYHPTHGAGIMLWGSLGVGVGVFAEDFPYQKPQRNNLH